MKLTLSSGYRRIYTLVSSHRTVGRMDNNLLTVVVELSKYAALSFCMISASYRYENSFLYVKSSLHEELYNSQSAPCFID